MKCTILAITFLSPALYAQETAKFAAPERLQANGEFVNEVEKTLYPSPVLVDIDGDGQRELVVGDLFGYLWVHEKSGSSWGPAKKLQVDGKTLKLPNW